MDCNKVLSMKFSARYYRIILVVPSILYSYRCNYAGIPKKKLTITMGKVERRKSGRNKMSYIFCVKEWTGGGVKLAVKLFRIT